MRAWKQKHCWWRLAVWHFLNNHNVHIIQVTITNCSRLKFCNIKQELSYRKQIARRLRTQFVEGISVTLQSTLRVTHGHWKRNHWTDHTRLTIRRVIGRWILSWSWNVGQSSLKVIESGTIWKFGYGFLTFPTLTLTLTMTLTLTLGFRGQGYWKWRRSIDHMWLSIGPPL